MPLLKRLCSLTAKKLDQKLFFYRSTFDLFHKEFPNNTMDFVTDVLESDAYNELLRKILALIFEELQHSFYGRLQGVYYLLLMGQVATIVFCLGEALLFNRFLKNKNKDAILIDSLRKKCFLHPQDIKVSAI